MKFVNIIYKYINEFIDEEKLVEELSNIEDHAPEIDELNEKIKNIIATYNGEMMRYQYTYEAIMNCDYYKSCAEAMTTHELMEMITSYIMVKNVPSIDQETFDELVMDAINNGEAPDEECWRLASNYGRSHYDMTKIVDHFIENENVYYMGELLSIIGEYLDIDDIITKIIAHKDTKFIKDIIDNGVIQNILDERQLNILKEALD